MGNPRKTSPDDIERMRTLRRQGLSLVEIGREVGRNQVTVLKYVGDIQSRHPIPVEKPERNAAVFAAIRAGETYSSVAKRFEISGPRVRQIVIAAEKREALAMAKAVEAEIIGETAAPVDIPAFLPPRAPAPLPRVEDDMIGAYERTGFGRPVAVVEREPEPALPDTLVAEAVARHGIDAAVERWGHRITEADIRAAAERGCRQIAPPVDDLPEHWLTRLGRAIRRLLGRA